MSDGEDHGGVSTDEVARPRRNGWACPWHPLQCLAWFFILFFALIYFGVLGHYIPGHWRALSFTLPAVLLIVLVVAMVMATSINPAEPAVREKMSRGVFSRPKFDRSKFPHVIQNNYCRLCQLNVSKRAKHCRICDKCIQDFDHHCKWLNSCVGSRNYKWFLAAVWSALVAVVTLLLYSFALFTVYFINEDASLLRFGCDDSFNLTACDPSLGILGFRLPSQANPIIPALCALCFVLSLIGVFLLAHLAFFHVYLGFRHQSTYDFFVQRRDNELRNSITKPHPTSKHLPLKKRVNRVTPVDSDSGECSSNTNHASLQALSSQQPFLQQSPSPLSSITSSRTADSAGSAGIATFGRTPPSEGDNLTDEQKLDMAYVCEKVGEGEEMVLDGELGPAVEPHLSPPGVLPLPLTSPPRAAVSEEEAVGRSAEEEGAEEYKSSSGELELPHSTPHLSHVDMALEESSHSNSHPEEDGGLQEMAPPSPPPLPHSLSPHPQESPLPSRNLEESSLQEIALPPRHPSPFLTSPSRDLSSAGSNDRSTPQSSPLPPQMEQVGLIPRGVSPPVTSVLGISEVVSQLHAGRTDSSLHPLHKRVSFQNLQEEPDESRPTNKPRPLPPIGLDVYHNDPLPPPPKSRRLPPLVHGQSDALSLYSTSSQSQLFSRSGSTYSLPLPDPRYSVTPPRSLTPSQDPHKSGGQREGRRTGKKQATRHSEGASGSLKAAGPKVLSGDML